MTSDSGTSSAEQPESAEQMAGQPGSVFDAASPEAAASVMRLIESVSRRKRRVAWARFLAGVIVGVIPVAVGVAVVVATFPLGWLILIPTVGTLALLVLAFYLRMQWEQGARHDARHRDIRDALSELEDYLIMRRLVFVATMMERQGRTVTTTRGL